MPVTAPGRLRLQLAVCAAATATLVAGCSGGQTTATTPDAGVLTELQKSYTDVVNRVLPSVVEIKSPSGVGSGVILDPAGNVVTNAHVVGRDTEFRVRLSTGAELPASLVATFPPDDIAVIRMRGASGLVPASWGNSSELEVGDIVMAMGSPLGLESSVTDGIVSAVGRTVPEPPGPAGPGTVLRQVIQTSAPINPGNSGGALVNAAGQVIGIPTLAAVNNELGSAANGIGFAVPSDVARDLANQMITHGRVVNSRRAALGITTTTVTDASGAPIGVGVVAVRPGGPAAAAGLRPGDVIIAIAGEPVTDVLAMQDVLARRSPGERVDLTVNRAGTVQTVSVVLEELATTQ
ncbi:MAG TPA: trypsin-like peptidase domain-containing protein [Pseudonocardia sp.]|uniref:S1C family serine protease n=1 Tax=Pseudonocardia sp. TaxID=60912 RepID=UPI002CE99EDC|nr:trypsin-like peptidase domain-containing protein [Pseudonocardia sp.]HTF46425.1 trypsin-like peptidase domain-containing protein [Pseudonocardia sp.]